MSHWILDKNSGEYYQPEHEDGGRQPQPDKNKESVHKFEVYFCGNDKEYEKFVKHCLKEFKNGGHHVPKSLTDKYPELLDIE